MNCFVVAYDIAEPRRLQRVHRLLCKYAAPLEYSVFLLVGATSDKDRCLAEVAQVIKAGERNAVQRRGAGDVQADAVATVTQGFAALQGVRVVECAFRQDEHDLAGIERADQCIICDGLSADLSDQGVGVGKRFERCCIDYMQKVPGRARKRIVGLPVEGAPSIVGGKNRAEEKIRCGHVRRILARAITRTFLVSERETMRYVKFVTDFTLKPVFML